MTASRRTIPVQAVWRAARRAAAMEITNPGIDGGLFARRVALVTGASHGIGAATARLLASLGAIARDIRYPQPRSARPPEGNSPLRACGRRSLP